MKHMALSVRDLLSDGSMSEFFLFFTVSLPWVCDKNCINHILFMSTLLHSQYAIKISHSARLILSHTQNHHLHLLTLLLLLLLGMKMEINFSSSFSSSRLLYLSFCSAYFHSSPIQRIAYFSPSVFLVSL